MSRQFLSLESVESQDFYGKDDLVRLMRSEHPAFVKEHEWSCDDVIERDSRFLEAEKPDTDHKRYLLNAIAHLLESLREYAGQSCEVFRAHFGSNQTMAVYVIKGQETIAGVLKGYSVHKTPEDEWIRHWGE